jgi:hypothetical protein
VDTSTGPRALRLPPPVAAALRGELPALADGILAVIAAEVPAYARPLEGRFGAGVAHGVQIALSHFLELAEGEPDASPELDRGVYVELGRGEVRSGRPLEALLTAYRVGARVSWDRLAGVGLRSGLDGPALVALAAAVFAYIDELSAASAQGYAAEQSALAGDRDRRLRALALALLAGGPAAQLGAAAAEAGWTPPATLSPLLLPGPRALDVAIRWDERTLVVDERDDALLLLPDVDGPGGRTRLDRLLDGRAAVLGLPVPWASVGAEVPLLRRAAALIAAGVLPHDRPVAVADELARLVVHADPAALAALRARRLAPFAELTDRSRDRLLATLTSWLRHHGDRQEIARELAVHPQTVRYRVGLLRELLGEALDDPQYRFELSLALVADGP